MSIVRQLLFSAGLIGALALLIWLQQQRINAAESSARAAAQRASTAELEQARSLSVVAALELNISDERAAQVALRTRQDQLRVGLRQREHMIEGLIRENAELRNWASIGLPDTARRLRQRPALTGADAYRQWLSERGALHAAGDGAGQ